MSSHVQPLFFSNLSMPIRNGHSLPILGASPGGRLPRGRHLWSGAAGAGYEPREEPRRGGNCWWFERKMGTIYGCFHDWMWFLRFEIVTIVWDSVSVWECLRCSSWVMWFVYCVVHHSPSHPYLGRRVLLMPTRLKRLESTGSLGWGHPSQIEAVSHWLFWMWNYGKHGRLIMFRNLVTSPVYDCNELLVFGSHHAGLHLRQDQKQMLNIVCSSEQCPMKQSVDSFYIYTCMSHTTRLDEMLNCVKQLRSILTYCENLLLQPEERDRCGAGSRAVTLQRCWPSLTSMLRCLWGVQWRRFSRLAPKSPPLWWQRGWPRQRAGQRGWGGVTSTFGGVTDARHAIGGDVSELQIASRMGWTFFGAGFDGFRIAQGKRCSTVCGVWWVLSACDKGRHEEGFAEECGPAGLCASRFICGPHRPPGQKSTEWKCSVGTCQALASRGPPVAHEGFEEYFRGDST